MSTYIILYFLINLIITSVMINDFDTLPESNQKVPQGVKPLIFIVLILLALPLSILGLTISLGRKITNLIKNK